MFTFRENFYRRAVRTFGSFILHRGVCILKIGDVIAEMGGV